MAKLAEVVQVTTGASRYRPEDASLKNQDDDDHVSIAIDDADTSGCAGAHDRIHQDGHNQRSTDSALNLPLRPDNGSMSLTGLSHLRSPSLDTPSGRTGPPRSLSFAYSLPQSPVLKTGRYPYTQEDNAESISPNQSAYYGDLDEELFFSVNGAQSNAPEFRTPLEYPQRESSFSSSGKDQSHKDKGKRRSTEESWLPKGLRWFHDSPRDEKAPSGAGDSYFSSLSNQHQPPRTATPAPPGGSNANSIILSTTLTDEPADHDHDSHREPKEASQIERESVAAPSSSVNGSPHIHSSSLLFRRQGKALTASQPVPDNNPLDELDIKNFGTAEHPDQQRAISVPSSPKTPTHKRLKRRWSFSSHHKPSSVATTSQRQLSTDGSKDDNVATGPSTGSRWSKLRALFPHLHEEREEEANPPAVAVSPNVNIIDELIAGGLATLMPKLWFERDQKGHRRVPILLHRLQLRITDSLHPLHKTKSVFRIECVYAGVAKWVIYRELKDFLTLHGQYTLVNAVQGASGKVHERLPEFPTTSLPYFKFLNKDGGGKISKADFARLQRQQLEDYLIGLIRAVMFHPSSNRLSAFLEISALSIALAQSGGAQYKAGYLKIEATSMTLPSGGGRGSGTTTNNTPGFGRKSVGWRERKEWRWCAVRESYLVALEQPGETIVWDVFLLDSDFKIERPKSDESEDIHRARTPLLDPSINPNPILTVTQPSENKESKGDASAGFNRDSNAEDNFQDTNAAVKRATEQALAKSKDVSRHTFYIVNSQTRLKLHARSERQMLQFIAALERIAKTSPFTKHHRFDSFAPVRTNVAAQWLVDGRDYFWNVSRAILLAKESIYLHDWWLSPEVLMRRPNMDRYRLDRLLERKAKEGVKIYIVLYLEVSNRTTPIDSNYTKQRLTSLHPNIMVQRAPSHFQTGTFYWAHHEKLCVIDQTIAFLGGLDICFGRWDTPQHALTDDTLDTDRPEIWPGKDYSNPRVGDFYTLNKPEEDMYDRTKVPRMPWHDVSLQIVGQPARDLARHFVQRWNYLLRIKNHSRTMPFLLPPPEYRPGQLTQLGLTGTCELQIVRSAGPWSTGTPGRVEHSIQNAYLKAIQLSEHFVYIENQFFITSTTVNEVKIENKIGDALVQRIIRAHKDGKPWKCCVMLPLLPGFTFPVDHSDASAIRIILECQNRTIARGSDSIFSKLRKEGIDPDDYISFFSLRNWAKMRGDILTTEQVYIHAKICIVDDRLAIIGSANINERSQRGDRDSEVAAVIRDTDFIEGTMAGKPFKVGRFAHTLRMRLMREHLGIDVDAADEENLMSHAPVQSELEQTTWDPDKEEVPVQEDGVTHVEKPRKNKGVVGNAVHFGAKAAGQSGYISVGVMTKCLTSLAVRGGADALSLGCTKGMQTVGLKDAGPAAQDATTEALEEERKDFEAGGSKRTGFASSAVPTLEEKTIMENRPRKESSTRRFNPHHIQQDIIEEERPQDIEISENGGTERTGSSAKTSTDDFVLLEPPPSRTRSRSNTRLEAGGSTTPRASLDQDDRNPADVRSILRKNMSIKSNWTVPTTRPQISFDDFEDPICDKFWKDKWVASAVHNTEIYRKVFHAIPDDLVTTWKQYKEFILHHDKLNKPAPSDPVTRVSSESEEDAGLATTSDVISETSKEGHASEQQPPELKEPKEAPSSAATNESFKRPPSRPAKGSEVFEKWERDQMEKLLGELNGHLVVYPTRFLEGEDVANNFLFNADRLLPLPIYN
ncbi:SPO14 [Coprinopsis cinerea okayama7|uniref:Phospholipase D1 n=1 Tax=Coprinopsis cinerea (strain Okayama-7 / 130 / ATCC MYA-4618 / FGSC 9003) TaxID=240176 RepID=A8NRS6_COPC7|nr:SPO14 [Coprinopsis cinerea okayama7\|eukprot:XP_001835844.2 SPO14 [Coprinopsis cinerea okayama7\